MAKFKYDFSGWVTRNNLECSDGRIIRHGAFADCDGKWVPLVWNHEHSDPTNVLGKVLLHNEDEGVFGYGQFNDTQKGQQAKMLLEHGDITDLSIYANKLKQNGQNVLHGAIREVSLVLAGANPGAYIVDVEMAHGDEADGEAIIYPHTGLELYHAEDEDDSKDDTPKEEKKVADTKEKTVGDVFNEFTEEQKQVVYYMIGQALEEKGAGDNEDEDKGENDVKHNVFDNDNTAMTGALTHADFMGIMADAKRCGSLKEAVETRIEDGTLMHAFDGPIPTDGMVGPSNLTVNQTYGFRDPDMLFPEYKSLNTPPEWIKRDTSWVAKVLNGAHHSPFSRIKSMFANLTEDEARARGYIKGHLKKEQVFTLLKRTTDPQTIYKKQKMDRDDIIDITDFDVVAWIKSEMRGQLDEEIARAILIGDGRLPSSDDKISVDHIRPIATDSDLFTIKAEVTAGSTDEETGKNFIREAIRARKYYKGSGQPTLFTTEDMLTSMLLIEDGIGHLLYNSVQQLATVLRVKEIVTVEVMEGFEVNDAPVLGIIVNMADYNIGADKGGAVELFDDFDIDYNQYKYLIETRCSGALTKPFSAIVFSQVSE